MHIEVNKFESIRAELVWSDEGGPLDLSTPGYTITIVEASAPALLQGTVAFIDASIAQAQLDIPAARATEGLVMGRRNWIRLALSKDGAVVDSTPPLWINLV